MRTGIFGGTFNPIHTGHMELARNVLNMYQLDRVIFIPSKIPPHKQVTGASSLQRYEMTKLAVEELNTGLDNAKYFVSDYEINSEGVSYTHRTLSYLNQQYPDDILFFIAGTDIFATIETWQNWEMLFDMANFIVVSRDSISIEDMLSNIPENLLFRVTENKYVNDRYGKILLYRMPHIPVSSTLIRNELNHKNLAESVYKYILNNNLY